MAKNAFDEEMSYPGKTIYYFAMYMVCVAALLITLPKVPLTLMGLPDAGANWIRILGVIVLILAYYYITLARNEVTAFFWASVRARSTVPFIFGVFVLLGWSEPVTVAFGLGDLAGAIWTWTALRKAAEASA